MKIEKKSRHAAYAVWSDLCEQNLYCSYKNAKKKKKKFDTKKLVIYLV